MGIWDTVSTDFGSDETAVFGQRQESGSALYQVETIATISSKDEEESVIPKVVSSVLGELACVAVEQHLAVFRDLQYTVTLGFESQVDVVEWSPEGRLLLIGDSQGMLLIHETQTMETVFSFMVVPEADRSNGKAFKRVLFQARDDDLHDLYCLSEGGRLFVIRNLDLSVFAEEVEDIGARLMEKMEFVNIQTLDYHTYGTNDIITTPYGVYTIGMGDSVLAVWEWSDGQLVIKDAVGDMMKKGMGMVMGKISTNNRHLLLKDINNSLTLWCSHTLDILKEFTAFPVSEFQLLETNDFRTNSVTGIKLVLMSVPEGGHCTLSICELPSLESIYTLQLVADTVLTQCIPAQEVLYVAEVCPSEKTGSSATVRFRCLTETNPETRLFRILHKKKFEEAEKFARLFKLDVELVYKVKLSHILDQLSPWNLHKFDEEKLADIMKQLWDCLQNIKDDADLSEKCIRAALPTFDETWKLLMFCKTRLQKSAELDEALMTKLLNVERRLVTFRYIYGTNEYRPETWDHFSKADLLKECLRSLRDGNTHTAFTLWARHQAEWKEKLDVGVIGHFLSEIPDQMKASDVQGFLQTSLIPYIGTVLPQALLNVVTWVIDKAYNMELLEKPNWPNNGLAFLREIHSSVSDALKMPANSAHNPSDTAKKSVTRSQSILQPLQDMMTSLQHLCNLHNKYKCPLRLTDFLQETTSSVVYRMLDKVVALELIVPTLERQIRPYMREHKLKEDQVFSRYIKDLLERTSNITTYSGGSLWETKAIAIIDIIKDPREKAEAILEVMKCAPLPLSDNVEQLIQRGLQIDHPIVKKLQEELHMIEVKKLMQKYGLCSMNLPTRGRVQQMMYHILARDLPTCLNDAIQLIQAYEMKLEPELYFFRLRWLVTNNRLDDYFDLLKSLTSDLSLSCGRRIITLAQVQLDTDMKDTQRDLEVKRLFTEAAVGTARLLLQDPQEHVSSEVYEEMRQDYLEMSALLALQLEYDKYLSKSQYQSQSSREAVLIAYLMQFFTSEGDVNYPKVYRLANLLQVPLVQLHGQLAIKASQTGDLETAVKHCSKLLESEPSWSTAETLYEVALSFMRLCKTEEATVDGASKLRDLSYNAHELAGLALTMCKPERLGACLDLFRALSLCQSVSRQCEVGEYSLSVQSPNSQVPVCQQVLAKETLDTWNLSPMFKEEALVMNSSVVLPLTVRYLLAHPAFMPGTKKGVAPTLKTTVVKEMYEPLLPLMIHLKENSHLELAYQFQSHLMSSLTQYTSQFDMGFQNDKPRHELDTVLGEVDSLKTKVAPLQHDLTYSILTKVFNAFNVDHKLALSYILSQPHKVVLEALKKLLSASGHNYKKLKALSQVGRAVGLLLTEAKVTTMSETLEISSTWGHRLSKIKIDFKTAFQGTSKEKLKILKTIAQNEAADVSMIKDYCRDFNLEVGEGLMVYIQHILSVDMPLWEGADNLVQRRTRAKKARAAIREMEKSDKLENELNKLLKQCNSYDYETIGFLLEELQRFDDPLALKGLELLEYISVYKRRYPPSEYEQQYRGDGEREELPGVIDTLPAASKTRVPFHPLMFGDAWKIITPELEDESVSIWLPIAKLLKLSEDQIPLMAIHNMVRRHVKSLRKLTSNDKNDCDWSFNHNSVAFLKKVQDLLMSVSNCEMGLACASWLFKELPMGGEKVIALKGCVLFAEKWYQACDESQKSQRQKAQAAYVKFATVYKRLSTERVLFLNDLAEPDLLQLCSKPGDLIIKLFEHPSITASWDCQVKKPDIHSVVTEISSVNELDLHDICFELIKKWLPSVDAKQETEVTMTFNFDNLKLTGEDVTHGNDDDNLTRVMYIMRTIPLEESVILVYNFIIKDSDNEITNQCRVRGLQCLLKMVCDKDLIKFCGKSAVELSEMLHTLNYLVELDKLHIQHSIRTFDECNKEGLIMGVWRNHSHQKTGVLLVASLCQDYKIYDTQLWNNILTQMLAQGMLVELEQVLIHLCGVPEVWSVAVFVKVWQAVLSSPLTKVCAPLNDDQVREILYYFNLMSRCPVVTSLDLSSLSRQYHNLELVLCAVGCLLMSPTSTNTQLQDKLDSNSPALLDDVKHLVTLGLNNYSAKQLEEFLYGEIEDNKEYASINKHHLHGFINFLIAQHNIDGMLTFAVQNNRMKEAGQLVHLYINEDLDIQEQVDEYMSSHGEEDLLQAYLKLKNIEID